LKEANEKLDKIEERRRNGWHLEKLQKEVSKIFRIQEKVIMEKTRTRKIALAKAVFAYCAYEELGEQGTTIARMLGISRPAVTKAIHRGRTFVQENNIKLIS